MADRAFEVAARFFAQEGGDSALEMNRLARRADRCNSVGVLDPDRPAARGWPGAVAQQVLDAAQGDRCAGKKRRAFRQAREPIREPFRMGHHEIPRLAEARAGRHGQDDIAGRSAHAQRETPRRAIPLERDFQALASMGDFDDGGFRPSSRRKTLSHAFKPAAFFAKCVLPSFISDTLGNKKSNGHFASAAE